MSNYAYDLAVLGIGGMGSACLKSLAERGARVCGIEQFELGHQRGSSHGRTRIIRKAYFEHPDYIPLLNSSYELWHKLAEECGTKLLFETGMLAAGRPDSGVVQGLERCYAQHALPHEKLDWPQVRQRFPQFDLPPDHVAFFDPIAGYLLVETCVAKQIEASRAHNATIFANEKALTWRAEGGGISIETTNRRITAGGLIITTGPWLRDELLQLQVELEIWRKVVLWYDSPNISEFRETFPIFYIETAGGSYYGFPAIDALGMKISEHERVQRFRNADDVSRRLQRSDEAHLLDFMKRILPAVKPVRTAWSVCIYTMTPDHHFILGPHPEHENVFVAGGFSGHGFKFAPVIGEALADLALNGSTKHAIDFLALQRLLPSNSK